MKLRRYLDKDQPENSICLMSIMNIKFKNIPQKIEEDQVKVKKNLLNKIDEKDLKKNKFQSLEKIKGKNEKNEKRRTTLKLQECNKEAFEFVNDSVLKTSNSQNKNSISENPLSSDKLNNKLSYMPKLKEKSVNFKDQLNDSALNNINNIENYYNNPYIKGTENKFNMNLNNLYNSNINKKLTNSDKNFILNKLVIDRYQELLNKKIEKKANVIDIGQPVSLSPLNEVLLKKLNANRQNNNNLDRFQRLPPTENKFYKNNYNSLYYSGQVLNVVEEDKLENRKQNQNLFYSEIENIFGKNLNSNLPEFTNKNTEKSIRNISSGVTNLNSKKLVKLNLKDIKENYKEVNTLNPLKLETSAKKIEISQRKIPQITTNKEISPNIIKYNPNSDTTLQQCINSGNSQQNTIQNLTFFYSVTSKKELPLFEKAMEHRTNWQLTPYSKTGKTNFLWKYSKKNVYLSTFNENSKKLETTRLFNHFEYNAEMTNKKFFFINLFNYCDENKIDPFSIVPFTIILYNKKTELLDNLKNFKDLFYDISNNNWEENKEYIGELYNKKFLLPNQKSGANVKIKIPSSYFIFNSNKTVKNFWILKPDNLCQGRLIKLFDNFDDVFKESKKYFSGVEVNKQSKKNLRYISNNLLLQKYIENPLLFYGRKFDIRVFILINHNLDLFFFKEGHLKLSSEAYNVDSLETFIHITNYSLQKKNPNFEKFEEGNELSFKDFQKYINSIGKKIDIYKDIIPKIKEKLIIAVNSCKKKLNKRNIMHTFEIYGCDLILDNNFNPFIFEINDNPGLSISSPIIEMIIPRIIDDALRLSLDMIFPTIYKWGQEKYISPFAVDGHSSEDNLFEFLCNLK